MQWQWHVMKETWKGRDQGNVKRKCSSLTKENAGRVFQTSRDFEKNDPGNRERDFIQ